MFRPGVMAFGVALCVVACSDNSVSGEVAGVGIDAVDSIAMSEDTSYDRPDGGKDFLSSITIVLTDMDEMCGRLERNVEKPNSRVLAFGVSKASETAPTAIIPGEYPFIGARPPSDGSFSAWETALKTGALMGGLLTVADAKCASALDEKKAMVSGGKVVIETVDEAHVVGTFELIFPGGETLTGRFDSPFCIFTKAATPATCGN